MRLDLESFTVWNVFSEEPGEIMKPQVTFFNLFVVATLFVISPLSSADEGMWTMDHLPKDKISKATGVKIDQAWIDKIMRSSVRLGNGCSASFVSSKGLVMTNHHCLRGCVYKLSTKSQNYLNDGFHARKTSEEKLCPALEANRLVEIKNVTTQVHKELKGLTGEAYSSAKKKISAELEKSCSSDPEKERCDLVDLYRGGEFHLYRYQRYTDVRLVFAPEQAMGHFGGDPDNFNFPRYSFDVSFVRVYDNGKPIENPHFFNWSSSAPYSGEPSFITGHPGSTQRLLTVSQLIDMRDHLLPQAIEELSELRGQLHQFQKRSAEFDRIAQAKLAGVENSLKAMKGRVQSLRDPLFFGKIQKKENEFRRRIQENSKLKSLYGNAWSDIEKTVKLSRRRADEFRYIAFDTFDSELISHARHLLRNPVEAQKPNGERLREYTDARLPQLKQALFSEAPIYDDLEILSIEFSLTKMREQLSPDHPFVRKVLGVESPADMARRLVKNSRLKTKKEREKLWNGGSKMVEQSQDPILVLVRLIDSDSRGLRKIFEETIDPEIQRNSEKIAKAQFDIFGKTTYPDATFSLRLSYGTVKGWTEKGQTIDPITRVAGVYQRATGSDPFALPKSWLKAKEKLNPQTAFNFVSTNDIIGGNSGSPVINKNAEIMGLVFDGNIHSLGGAYGFDESMNRAVSLDAGLIKEALEKVYSAEQITQELGK